jgi:hypothetical protein
MQMKNKKSVVPIEVLIWLLVGIITLLILGYMIPKLLGKSGAEASELLTLSSDDDGDGIPNYKDKCDCNYGDEANEGCPINMEKGGDIAIQREELCKEQRQLSKTK